MTLVWAGVPEAESYELLRDGSTVIQVGSGTSHTDRNLTPRTAYSYQVRAIRRNARSHWSAPVRQKTKQ